MLDVKQQKSNTLQADVLRVRAEKIQISQLLTGPKKRLLSYRLAAKNPGVFLSPRSIREMKSPEWEGGWMQVAENQPESAAIGGGGMGTNVTTLN